VRRRITLMVNRYEIRAVGADGLAVALDTLQGR
jgi:hypothetical protein